MPFSNIISACMGGGVDAQALHKSLHIDQFADVPNELTSLETVNLLSIDSILIEFNYLVASEQTKVVEISVVNFFADIDSKPISKIY